MDVLRQERTGDVGLVRLQDPLSLPAVRWSPEVRSNCPKGDGPIVLPCSKQETAANVNDIGESVVSAEVVFEPCGRLPRTESPDIRLTVAILPPLPVSGSCRRQGFACCLGQGTTGA